MRRQPQEPFPVQPPLSTTRLHQGLSRVIVLCRSPASSTQRPAFSLLEMLIVMAILSALLGILLPALAGARCEATKAKCLANLHALGQALATYSTDDEMGYTSPVHPMAEKRWFYDGEYEYGGKTGVGYYRHSDFVADNRILNKYLFRNASNAIYALYECPSDTGIPKAPYDFDDYFFQSFAINLKTHEVTGTSYRLNNHIDFTGRTPFKNNFYGPYMRPITQVPDTAETVILEEAVAEVAKWNATNYRTMGWHCKPNRFNVSFVDGHAEPIYLAGQNDMSETNQDYWILRGPSWRMDCYPDPPILDRPRSE